MTHQERERLLKLLALTASTNDGEALSAMRRASEMLGRLNLSWDSALIRASGLDADLAQQARGFGNQQANPWHQGTPYDQQMYQQQYAASFSQDLELFRRHTEAMKAEAEKLRAMRGKKQ